MNDKYRQPGATSAIVENLRVQYEAQGHEVHILTTHRKEQSAGIIHEGHVTSLPVSYRPSLRHWLCLYRPSVTRMLKETIPGLKPDVVHAHNVHTYLTYDALRIASQSAPVFITMHDVMSFAFRRLATPRFLDSEGQDCKITIFDHLKAAGLQYNPLRNFCIRCALKDFVRQVLPVSAALEKALHQNGIGHTTVVHNAIDTRQPSVASEQVAAFRKKHGLNGRKVILFGGRLSRDKGTREILQALAKVKVECPDALLLVTGDSVKWDAFVATEDRSSTLSPWYKCTDWLAAEEIRTAFAAADVVTTPSLCLDTFNMMNIEAMTAGKPVVGTIFGGTAEIVQHGKTGFVVDPRDTDAYANYLITLLKNETLAKQMGKAGRERIEKEFTLELQAKRYVSLFKEVTRS